MKKITKRRVKKRLSRADHIFDRDTKEAFYRTFGELSYRRKVTLAEIKECVITLVNADPEQRKMIQKWIPLLRDRHRRVSTARVM